MEPAETPSEMSRFLFLIVAVAVGGLLLGVLWGSVFGTTPASLVLSGAGTRPQLVGLLALVPIAAAAYLYFAVKLYRRVFGQPS